MDRKTAIRELQGQLKWLLKQEKATPTGGRRAQTVMIACFQAVHEVGWRKAGWHDEWIHRWGFRRPLRDIRASYITQPGKRALRRLLELAITELESCVWKTTFAIGALPLAREYTKSTAAQKAALDRGRSRINTRRREERASWRESLKTRVSCSG